MTRCQQSFSSATFTFVLNVLNFLFSQKSDLRTSFVPCRSEDERELLRWLGLWQKVGGMMMDPLNRLVEKERNINGAKRCEPLGAEETKQLTSRNLLDKVGGITSI